MNTSICGFPGSAAFSTMSSPLENGSFRSTCEPREPVSPSGVMQLPSEARKKRAAQPVSPFISFRLERICSSLEALSRKSPHRCSSIRLRLTRWFSILLDLCRISDRCEVLS